MHLRKLIEIDGGVSSGFFSLIGLLSHAWIFCADFEVFFFIMVPLSVSRSVNSLYVSIRFDLNS